VKYSSLCVPFVALSLIGCSSSDDPKTDADYEREVVTGMHDKLLGDIQLLHDASVELQNAAPTPADRGWDAAQDQAAITAMTNAWLKARGAYERTEGALAPLFPDIDAAIDARFDDFLAEGGPDDNLFDDQGVTGMHAIERILFSKTTPANVVTAEAALPGYKAAAWPAAAQEAADFKTKLCARLAADTKTMADQWKPQKSDLGNAFKGLSGLMNEQLEKIVKAASAEEESRYAQRTMADIRDNLTGTINAYGLFRAWVKTKSGGAEADAKVENAFNELKAAYSLVTGDALPPPPATWSAENPSPADLQTPFGKLYGAVKHAVDPNQSGSAVDGMNQVAKSLGFPEFAE
jgi:iron uptake system component EfeO